MRKQNSINRRVCEKFAMAAGVLLTRVFSQEPEANPRRLAFACGPIMKGPAISANPDSRFDILGLGFKPGREWSGPCQIFIEERPADELVVWENCRFWTDVLDGPFYILTEDEDVCFSYDGYSLVRLSGTPSDRDAGAERALERLRDAARRAPDNYERRSIM